MGVSEVEPLHSTGVLAHVGASDGELKVTKRVVIIGCGPAGLCAAVFLARAGCSVQVGACCLQGVA